MPKRKGKVKIDQSDHDRVRHLCEHLDFIRASASSFDTGFHGEAKRIAVSVRLLLHDTGQSRSLLEQLSVKRYLRYLSTARPDNPRNVAPYNGLIGITLGPAGVVFHPHLAGGYSSTLSFHEWWNSVVLDDRKGNRLTRADIILCVANQDGGAHVDSGLDVSYARIARENSLGLTGSSGGISGPIRNPELFSIRQVAYELLTSLSQIEEQARTIIGVT